MAGQEFHKAQAEGLIRQINQQWNGNYGYFINQTVRIGLGIIHALLAQISEPEA